MLDKNFKEILNNRRSVLSSNKDIRTNIDIISKYRELPYNEITEIVNAYNVFSTERNDSKTYRVISTIKLLASNPLFSPTSLTTFLNTSISQDKEAVYNEKLKDDNGWFGYYDTTPNTYNNFIDIEPTREFFHVSDYDNWNFLITYPALKDSEEFLIKDGVLLVDSGTANISGTEKLLLISPIKHNLSIGDKVNIYTNNQLTYNVIVLRLGKDNGDFKDYSFVVDLSSDAIAINDNVENIRFKKIYLNQESEYYYRIFKPISTGLTSYNLAFSKTIYNDNVSQLVFNDFNIDSLTDNLNRPLSELFITAIKKKSFNNVIYINNLKSGVKIPYNEIDKIQYHKNICDIQRIHDVTSYGITTHNNIETDITIESNNFYGDIVEYNKLTLEENVLADINYCFNLLDRINNDNPRPESYYYKPHHKLIIRQFSNYIEVGDDSVINKPLYCEKTENNNYIWRDLLPLGFNDGSYDETLDYPFINNTHYLYSDLFLNIRRQDPFNIYGLYYDTTFDKDIFGDSIDTTNVIIKKGDAIC